MSDFDDSPQDWFRRAKIVADGREQITWDWITEAIRFRKIVQRIEDRLPYHGESPVREDHTETITLGGDEINEMRAALTPKGRRTVPEGARLPAARHNGENGAE